MMIFGVHDYFIRENRKIGQNRGIYFRPVQNRFMGPKRSKKRRCVQKMGYLANSYGENGPFEDFHFYALSESMSIMGSILH